MAELIHRILLLLAIKKEGKVTSFSHIAEKVLRDHGGGSTKDVEKALEELIAEGLAEKKVDGYIITPEGRRKAKEILKDVWEELNLSYRRVLEAREYYPEAAGYMLPFLKGRAVSVIKVFSDDSNPIKRLKPLFVRYARRKPKTPITVNSAGDLQRLLDAHAVDFIPYVHSLNSKKPDWFILDLDAGEEYKKHENWFELLKIVAGAIAEVLREYNVKPYLKFSGSRGIQIWASLDNSEITGDVFAIYRKMAVFVQQKAEEKLQQLPHQIIDRFYSITAPGKPITTSKVAGKAERADQILVDWSSMKPNGDVRAPFSMHYATGLISVPIVELERFSIDMAKPEIVVAELDKLSEAFELSKCSPKKLLKNIQ